MTVERWSPVSETKLRTFDDDVKTVARVLRVTPNDVANLTGYQCIESDILTGKVSKG